MIDLETLDITPSSVILSIGAVKFNGNGITQEFYQNVCPESCKRLGMTTSQETIDWWNQQGEDAKKRLEDNKIDIADALKKLNEWYGETGVDTWGNGAGFDVPILEHAYRLTGIPCPWKFYMSRCYRTVNTLFGQKRVFKGVKHNALDDAKHQAESLVEIHNRFIDRHSHPEKTY